MTVNNKKLIDKLTVAGTSDPFDIGEQVTVVALGLEPTDVVYFEIVLLSDPVRNMCACPPLLVTPVSVIDAVPLLCCGERVELTRNKPFVVIDVPQNAKLRAVLQQTPPGPITTQFVYYSTTNTKNVNDRLRGCPCVEGEGA